MFMPTGQSITIEALIQALELMGRHNVIHLNAWQITIRPRDVSTVRIEFEGRISSSNIGSPSQSPFDHSPSLTSQPKTSPLLPGNGSKQLPYTPKE